MVRNTDNTDLDFLKIQYQALSSKQLSHHTSMWNAPSLLFVAQTFLWGISLDNSINILIRCLVSSVSVVIAFAALQNFIRNRWMEIADCEQLAAIEKFMKNRADVVCPAMIIHNQLTERTLISPNGKKHPKVNDVMEKNKRFKKSWIGHLKTYNVWKIVLGVVIVLAIILFIYNLYLATRIFKEIGSIARMLDYNINLA